jgi:hypothetical protein
MSTSSTIAASQVAPTVEPTVRLEEFEMVVTSSALSSPEHVQLPQATHTVIRVSPAVSCKREIAAKAASLGFRAVIRKDEGQNFVEIECDGPLDDLDSLKNEILKICTDRSANDPPVPVLTTHEATGRPMFPAVVILETQNRPNPTLRTQSSGQLRSALEVEECPPPYQEKAPVTHQAYKELSVVVNSKSGQDVVKEITKTVVMSAIAAAVPVSPATGTAASALAQAEAVKALVYNSVGTFVGSIAGAVAERQTTRKPKKTSEQLLKEFDEYHAAAQKRELNEIRLREAKDLAERAAIEKESSRRLGELALKRAEAEAELALKKAEAEAELAILTLERARKKSE